MDIAPSFYEVAKTEYPPTFGNKKLHPLKGTSIMPVVSGAADEVHSSEYVFGLEHNGRAMLRKGHWKITSNTRPFLLENFALYDLSKDVAELHDLKDLETDKYQELLQEWSKFSNEIKAQFPPPNSAE